MVPVDFHGPIVAIIPI